MASAPMPGTPPAPPVLCRRSCGYIAAAGLDKAGRPLSTCCRGCALGRAHDRMCARQLPAVPCKMGCGLACAEGFNRRGTLFDTCCRGCAVNQGHDDTCAKVPAPALDARQLQITIEARSSFQQEARSSFQQSRRRRWRRRFTDMVQKAEMWDPVWGELRFEPGTKPSNCKVLLFCCCPGLAVALGLSGTTVAERRVAYRRFLLSWAMFFALLQLVIMVVMVAIDGMAPMAQNPMLGPSPTFISFMGAKHTELIVVDNQWWRLFTPMMLHGGWLHLVGNLCCQLQTGVMLEAMWSHASWLFIYLGCGLFATLASCAVAPLSMSVGSSGSLCGLLGAWLTFMVVTWNQTLPNDIKLRNMNMLSVIISIAVLAAMFPAKMIDHAAHGGGLIFGALLAMLVFAGRLQERRWRLATRFVGIGLAVLLACGTWVLFAYRSNDIFGTCLFPACV